MTDRQVARWRDACEAVARTREAEADALADAVASLDDATALRFARARRARGEADQALRELIAAGSALVERARFTNPQPELEPPQRGVRRDPTSSPGRTGEGRLSPSPHCSTIGGSAG